MKKGIKIILILIFLILGFGIYKFYNYSERIKGEYLTMGIIRETTRYIIENNGIWPSSWKELNQEEKFSKYVKMDFNISIEEIVKNNDLIFQVIVPAKGDYIMYPHAKEDLGVLLKEIQKIKGSDNKSMNTETDRESVGVNLPSIVDFAVDNR